MTASASRAVSALLVLLLCLVPALPVLANDNQARPGARLAIHGSNTIGEELAPALLAGLAASAGLDYQALETRAVGEQHGRIAALAIQLHTHGSGTGFQALLTGRADLAMSSRPVSASELALAEQAGLGRLDSPAQEFIIALDGVAVIVHPDNPLASTDLATLRDVFSGRIGNWRDLGGAPAPIRVLARDDNSGTYDTFASLVLQQARLAAGTERFESTQALAQAVADDRHAIGFVGQGGIGRARALSIRDGSSRSLPPQPMLVALEDYLLSRRLYLYLPAGAAPMAQVLADFAISDTGQAIVEDTGFVAQTMTPLAVASPHPAPAEYQRLTAGAQRLPLNFRFDAGASVFDNKAMRDLDRLLRFMRSEGGNGRNLRLFGFSDSSEVMPFMSVSLAHERVEYVATMLARHGVHIQHGRGLGAQLPVASDASAWGRQRNRRVEVWITDPASTDTRDAAP
ncbi:MAG: substrate-binding domain-containing protein [Xanthomonadales bacterium]|nr:substrate-binding domain-containing protein [Xanthomonadales bacterium]